MTHPAGEDDVVSTASRQQIVHLWFVSRWRGLRATQKQFKLLLFWEKDQVQFSFGLIYSTAGHPPCLYRQVPGSLGWGSHRTWNHLITHSITHPDPKIVHHLDHGLLASTFAMPLNASHHLLFIPQACLPPPGAPPPTRSQASSLRRSMSRS